MSLSASGLVSNLEKPFNYIEFILCCNFLTVLFVQTCQIYYLQKLNTHRSLAWINEAFALQAAADYFSSTKRFSRFLLLFFFKLPFLIIEHEYILHYLTFTLKVRLWCDLYF